MKGKKFTAAKSFFLAVLIVLAVVAITNWLFGLAADPEPVRLKLQDDLSRLTHQLQDDFHKVDPGEKMVEVTIGHLPQQMWKVGDTLRIGTKGNMVTQVINAVDKVGPRFVFQTAVPDKKDAFGGRLWVMSPAVKGKIRASCYSELFPINIDKQALVYVVQGKVFGVLPVYTEKKFFGFQVKPRPVILELD